MAPRSSLRWKPTSKIFKTDGLRWVPTGKIFTSSTTEVDSEPTNGSNADITNQYECEQTLDVSAGTLNLSAGTSFNPKKEGLRVCLELRIHDHINEPSSSKLVPKVVPPAHKTATSRQELELLFHHHIRMLSVLSEKVINNGYDHIPTTSYSTTNTEKSKGGKVRMPTKIELTLEQSQQGVSNDVLVKTQDTQGWQRRSRQNDKDLKTPHIKTKSKELRQRAQEQRSQSMKNKPTTNSEQRSQELNDKSNHIDAHEAMSQ
ncbi:hypothetical protein Tco_0357462 [Tanacetum coccineum]